MNRQSIIGMLLAVALMTADASAQKLSKDEREILWHQDQRSLSDSVLARYARHKEARIRSRAALALANIQDTSSLPILVPLLADRFSDVRAAAAFAIGQIGSPAHEQELAERLRLETNDKVIARLLEALGKSGSQGSYDDVVAYGLPRKSAALKADQALSLARFALRSIKSERGVWFCFDLLEEKDPRIRWMALYALWRIAPHGAVDVEVAKRKDILGKLTADTSPDVRINLATLLGRVKTDEAYALLRTFVKNEEHRSRRNWRVRVNLARAFAQHVPREKDALDQLSALLDLPQGHVQIATLNAIVGLSRDPVRRHEHKEALGEKLQKLASPSRSRPLPLRGEALVALAKHFPAEFTFAGIVGDSTLPNLLRAKALEGVSQIPSTASLHLIVERLEDDSLRVAMAAWDFLRQLLAPQSYRTIRRDTAATASLGATLFRKAKVSLLREDMAITNLVAAALSDSSINAILRAEGMEERALEELMLAYTKLSSPNDVETMQAVLEALGKIGDERTVPIFERAIQDPDRTVGLAAAAAYKKITGRDIADQVVTSTRPLFSDYDWRTLESIPASLPVEIKTSKGTIVIALQKEHAPFTVLSLYRLIRKKFYDGLTFHRVVPNFVVQGGDPRGDGWGGPNYALRTEVSLVGYDRGVLGIASAGKDTEGCQFFITHSPQPHLDGRYTIIGRVTNGLGIVDQIQIGDRIESIRIKR